MGPDALGNRGRSVQCQRQTLVLGTRSAVIVAATKCGAMAGDAFPFTCILERLIHQDLKYEQERT